ncbi:3'-5' exonuclease domain-containing protein 2 [Akkermansiaceae bacterium]|nr:3'-5' exonuclease domain-containing protein 2 [Akkermansiaceae bacterium]MDB4436016.1 3'-5' exonuclease domain-containing protein 2 [Akkermansiaceae bacterium]
MSVTEPLPNNEGRSRRPRRRKPRRPASSSDSNADDAESENKEKPKKRTGPVAPTKAETALLPPFLGLSLDDIHIPSNQAECRQAVEEIYAAGVTGFDTEAKPTFRKGQKCDGPHVVQFSLTNKAFIFQLHRSECEDACAEIIESQEVLKVGFGLKNDHSQIRSRFGIVLNHVLDLDQSFKKMGYPGQIGVRGAIGVLLNLYFKKSKSTTTSNWALPRLTPRQLTYAANDAYAALKVMEALEDQDFLKKR